MTNEEIARSLQQHATALRKENDNLYRVRAYRQAAEMVLRLDWPVEGRVRECGKLALAEVPGIGRRLSANIAAYLETGKWPERN